MAVHLPAEFQCIENNIVLPERQLGTLRDLGYYGILLESETEISARAEIKLSFNLPRVNFDATDVYAKVVTAKEGNDKWLYGVEFTSIGEHAMEQIQWFVQLLVLTEAA